MTNECEILNVRWNLGFTRSCFYFNTAVGNLLFQDEQGEVILSIVLGKDYGKGDLGPVRSTHGTTQLRNGSRSPPCGPNPPFRR